MMIQRTAATLVPWSLVVFRGVVAPGLLAAATMWNANGIATSILLAAFFSDWFDGVLARRWGTSTAALRRADSRADVACYFGVLAIALATRRVVLEPWLVPLAGLVLCEAVCQISNHYRFGCGTATHAWSCKAWAVLLCLASIDLLWQGVAGELMAVCIGWGYVAYLDVFLILWLLPRPAVDVPTAWHAWRQRQRIAGRPQPSAEPKHVLAS